MGGCLSAPRPRSYELRRSHRGEIEVVYPGASRHHRRHSHGHKSKYRHHHRRHHHHHHHEHHRRHGHGGEREVEEHVDSTGPPEPEAGIES
jgi:hypothetical protein